MASGGSIEDSTGDSQCKATRMWRQLVHRFRSGMPTSSKRLKLRRYEQCFTGWQATEWMLNDMQASGLFTTVTRPQVVTLLDKFIVSDVIEPVKGKNTAKFDDGPCLYRFVRTPGPFNFIEQEQQEQEEEQQCEQDGWRAMESSRGKGKRPSSATCFTNLHASFTDDSPVKSSAVCRQQLTAVDTNSCQLPAVTTPGVVAVWRDIILPRLLCLLGVSSLDGILSDDAVNGDVILLNVCTTQLPVDTDHQSDAVEAFPRWVIMAFKHLSNWPDGCTGTACSLPVYPRFPGDVLAAICSHLSQLSDPLIHTNLYSVYTTVLPLIDTGDVRAVPALQLCCLMLPKCNRVQLHRLLRFIYKASMNASLVLSDSTSNKDMLLQEISSMILRPASHQLTTASRVTESSRDVQRVVWFMCQHYHNIFKIPSDLQLQVKRQQRLQHTTTHEEGSPVKLFCQQVSEEQYRAQTSVTSHYEISQLLDSIVSDENMSSKTRKRRLKQFQKVYPVLFAAKFPDGVSKSK